jgi:hypothetical protein
MEYEQFQSSEIGVDDSLLVQADASRLTPMLTCLHGLLAFGFTLTT